MGWLIALSIIIGIVGILGAVIPGIPGPPLSWAGYLLAWISAGCPSEMNASLWIWLAVCILVTVLDYILPSYLTKAAGGHKAASAGAVIGLFAGIILTPIGMIAGSIIGAFIGEFLFANGGVWESFKASMGAFAGFIVMTIMKLGISGILLWKSIAWLF